MTRYDYNMKILKALEKFFTDYKDMRFCQGLINCGAMEDSMGSWNEESHETYKNICDFLHIDDKEEARNRLADQAMQALKNLGIDTTGLKIVGNKIVPAGNIPDMSREEKIMHERVEQAVDDFDCEGAARVFAAMKWEWGAIVNDDDRERSDSINVTYYIPNENDIRKAVRERATEACRNAIETLNNGHGGIAEHEIIGEISSGRINAKACILEGEGIENLEVKITLEAIEGTSDNWYN